MTSASSLEEEREKVMWQSMKKEKMGASELDGIFDKNEEDVIGFLDQENVRNLVGNQEESMSNSHRA